MVTTRTSQRYLVVVVLELLLITSCRDSPADSKKSQPTAAVTASSIPPRKPSCDPESRGSLDAPLRHAEWASTVDVARLKGAASKLNAKAKRLNTELRAKILKQHDIVSLADRALATASDTVWMSCEQFVQAYVAFRDRAAPLRARNDDRSRAVVHSSDVLMDVIECWTYVSDPRLELEKVEREVAALRKLDTASDGSLMAAINDLDAHTSELDRALADRQSKHAEYVQAAAQMGDVLSKVARVVGLAESDRRILATAFEVLPKINIIVQQLDLIGDEAAVKRENVIVRPTDVMCWTSRLVEKPARVSEGRGAEAPTELHELWEQRLGAVHDLVDQALAVPGTEW